MVAGAGSVLVLAGPGRMSSGELLQIMAVGQRLTRLRTARTARARRTGSVRREVISM